jgi:hypothetical protein
VKEAINAETAEHAERNILNPKREDKRVYTHIQAVQPNQANGPAVCMPDKACSNKND